MPGSYYNTTDLEGERLQKRIEQAESQEEMISELFEMHPDKKFTPYDVWKIVFSKNVPITSVRRAMTNLTDEEVLVKTGEQREGPYGQPNYCWQLSKQPTLF